MCTVELSLNDGILNHFIKHLPLQNQHEKNMVSSLDEKLRPDWGKIAKSTGYLRKEY